MDVATRNVMLSGGAESASDARDASARFVAQRGQVPGDAVTDSSRSDRSDADDTSRRSEESAASRPSSDVATELAQAPAEERTFDALYEAHFAFVWRTLRRFGVPASVAEDAAQDAFVVLHRKLDDLRPEASTKGFLFSIARRVASDYRRASRRPSTVLDAERTASMDRGPFDRTADREAGALLERFLESLDEDKRVAFMLVELEGLTVPEVSQLLDTNLNTLYSRVRSARAQLMALLANDGDRHG